MTPDLLPGALRELIDTAENALSALAERDLLAARYEEQQQLNQCNNPENQASGSGTNHHEISYDPNPS